jgi:hypothetical protein
VQKTFWYLTNRVRSTNRPVAGGRTKTFSLSLRAPRRKTKPQCFSVLYYRPLHLGLRAQRLYREYLAAKEAPGGPPSSERAWLLGHAVHTLSYEFNEDDDDVADATPSSSDEDSAPEAPEGARARRRKPRKKGKKPGVPLSFKTAVANAAFEAATPEQHAEVDSLFSTQSDVTAADGSVEARSL